MKSIPLLKWSYFPSDSAVLLDKIHKFEDKSFELGGEAAAKLFNKKNSVAVHTTCYEQKSKVMGLKVKMPLIRSAVKFLTNALLVIHI